MYIAYCDDEFHFLKDFMNEFSDLFNDDNLVLFSTPEELLKLHPMPDVVFMDIEFDSKKTGLDYAEKIYEISPGTAVIFVTAYTEKFVQDIFVKNINVKGFLAKPVRREYLEQTLNKVRVAAPADTGKKVLLKTKNSAEAVSEASISYAESSKHTTIVHTDNGDYVLHCKLSEMTDVFSEAFQFCHKSYIVNMNRITAFKRTEVILDTGKNVPVSRSRYLAFKDIYFDYITNME